MPQYLALPGLAALFGLLVSPALGLLGKLLRIGGLRREGVVKFDERGLVLEQEGVARHLGYAVASGVIAPRDGGWDVQLRLKDGNAVSVLVDDEASAEALLDLVGVGRERRRTKVRWAKLRHRLSAGVVGVGVGLIAGLTAILSTPEPLMVLAVVAGFVLPFLVPGQLSKVFAWREFEVGADGIAWRYWLRRKVLPLSEVRAVTARDGQLIVRLTDGTDRRFEIPTEGVAEGLRRRIEDALAAMGGAQGRATLFARGDLAFNEWVARMRSLLSSGGAFREAPVHVEDALRVLEDADAEPDLRVGAALALHETERPELAARVRVVADNCVSPKLRVALQGAASGAAHEEVVEAAQHELRLKTRPGERADRRGMR